MGETAVRTNGLGHAIFALSMMGLGLLSLLFHDFALQWQPVPAGFPARETLAYVSGAVLLAGGLGLFVRRLQPWAALLLAVELLVWVLAQLPQVMPAAANVAAWLPVAEDVALLCGALSVALQLDAANLGRPAVARGVRVVFGLACLVFGVSHFVYAGFTAQMIPAWLPFHAPLAYLTGAGHAAAGLALIFDVLPRLAAACEAAMMSLFVLLVHVPMVAAHPPAAQMQLDWTMLCVAAGLSGAAWSLARGLSDRPWGVKARAE